MDKIKDDLKIDMNFTNADDHVPEAEQNNHAIKECIWVAFHHLPYKAMHVSWCAVWQWSAQTSSI